MNTKVLESWGEEEVDIGNGIGEEVASLGRLRSKSMSRGLPKKASRNAGIIKVIWIQHCCIDNVFIITVPPGVNIICQILNRIGLNVSFMTQKGATWIYTGRKALSRVY